MNRKWAGSLVLSTFLLGLMASPALGVLNKGEFIPACRLNSISTDSGVKYYRVKKGDTLWDISRNFQVDLQTVIAINNLDKNSILSVGQTLEIPYRRSRVHVIRKGETMWDIAAKYEVSVEQLINVNQGKNPRNLTIGDKLNIPDSTSRPVTVAKVSSRSMQLVNTTYAWPIVGTITSKYGWRSSGFHHGIDIAGETGDPVKAAASGKVSFTGHKPVYGYTVEIEHPDGYRSLYAHLQKIQIARGQQVTRGQVIGTVGTTGRTTGPHLHFEIKNGEQTLNPLSYLRY